MLIYKICQNIRSRVGSCLDHCITHLIFIGNSVHFRRFYSHGIPRVLVSRGGTLVIGDDFHMNNGLAGNPIGFVQPCCFFIQPGATIKIGDHVGMSSTALVAAQSKEIGNGVKIGGGVCIYDTDFHSLNPCSRQNPELDRKEARSAPVKIGNHVFIGARSMILKGVHIGDNSIVGAGSVVSKDIPPNEIWAGNPARKLRSSLMS